MAGASPALAQRTNCTRAAIPANDMQRSIPAFSATHRTRRGLSTSARNTRDSARNSLPGPLVGGSMSAKPSTPRKRKVNVSDKRIQQTAMRLLNDDLVSVELRFVQNELGNTATQDEIDQAVTQVRNMPWSKLMSAI
jgi:hypothetical protein